MTAQPEVAATLLTAGTWEFDAFRLAEVTEQKALSTLAFWVFQNAGLIEAHGEA